MASKGPLGLSADDKGGVFFLYGDDRFRKEEEALALVDWHLEPGTRDFNFDPLRGSEVTVETLASVLATPPMMAEWRVVLLRETEALTSSPHARATLLSTVAAPPPGLAFIAVADIPKGSSAKIYQELIRKARSVEFRQVHPNDVPAWLVDRAAGHHGREITEEAARALAGAVGTDLGILAQELGKLVDSVEPGAPVDLEAVRRSGTHLVSVDRWEWMDRVGNRDFSSALVLLEALFGQGESGVGLVSGLASHLIRLGVARTGGPGALETVLPPRQKWLVRRLLPQAKRWSVEELQDALLGLRRVDRLMKSSQLPQEHLLEEWFLTLMARDGEKAEIQ